MKVNEASKELQELIFQYYKFDANDSLEEENVYRTLNELLHNIKCELMQNYHYDSNEDRKLSMRIQRKINSLGA